MTLTEKRLINLIQKDFGETITMDQATLVIERAEGISEDDCFGYEILCNAIEDTIENFYC